MPDNVCSYNPAESAWEKRKSWGSGQFIHEISTWKKVDFLKTSFLLLLLVVALFPLPGKANPLQATLEPKTATVGDPLELTITLPGKEASQIIWPPVSGNLGDFTLLGSDTLDNKKSGEYGGPTIIYTLAAYDTGGHSTGTIYLLVDGDSLEVPDLRATIVSVLNDTTDTDFRTFKAQEDLPITLKDVFLVGWPWALGLIILITAWLLFKRWLKKRKHPFDGVEYEHPALPPYDEAVEALRQLEEKNPLAEGNVKEFISRLSEIIKRLLGRVHNDPVLEMTTYEVKNWIHLKKKLRFDAQPLTRLLDEGDMVKFAKGVLYPDDCRAHLEAVRKMVEQYKPSEEVSSEENSEPGVGAEESSDSLVKTGRSGLEKTLSHDVKPGEDE